MSWNPGGDVLISKWLFDPSPERNWIKSTFNPRINHGSRCRPLCPPRQIKCARKIRITIAINCAGAVFCCFCLSSRHTAKTIRLNMVIVRTQPVSERQCSSALIVFRKIHNGVIKAGKHDTLSHIVKEGQQRRRWETLYRISLRRVRPRSECIGEIKTRISWFLVFVFSLNLSALSLSGMLKWLCQSRYDYLNADNLVRPRFCLRYTTHKSIRGVDEKKKTENH